MLDETKTEEIMAIINSKILESGYKHVSLAKKIGITASNFSLSLNGKRKWSTVEAIGLCYYLGLDVNDFYHLFAKGEQNAKSSQ